VKPEPESSGFFWGEWLRTTVIRTDYRRTAREQQNDGKEPFWWIQFFSQTRKKFKAVTSTPGEIRWGLEAQTE